MARFSNDVDLLKYEPALFGDLMLTWQIIAQGTNGAISGTTFTSTGAKFVTAKVTAGDVINLVGTGIDGAFEVVSVNSETQLTVSALRESSEDAAIALPTASNVVYKICTYRPQAVEAAFQITEYLGIAPGKPSSENDSEDILYPESLKRASVFAILASLYATLVSSIEDQYSQLWKKSTYYQGLFEKEKAKLRVSIDSDGDGVADTEKDGSSRKLSRD
jgi:hypothetical protein